jgi:hypothetical protein
MRFANAFIVSAYVNLVLTNHRLIAFEDTKGALNAGARAGAGGGLIGAAIDAAASANGSPTERIVAKGITGSIKFDAPISAITGVVIEDKKNGQHTLISTTDSKKPLDVVLGLSFDGVITPEMFREALVKAIQPT